MLNNTYSDRVTKDIDQYLSDRNEYIDQLVDKTFSAEVLEDLKDGLLDTDIKLLSLTPPAVCKLLMTALINKEYNSLPELFSSVDLRGMHVRTKCGAEQEATPQRKQHVNTSYRTDASSYEYMLMKIGNYITNDDTDAEFNNDVQKAMQRYEYKKGDNALSYLNTLPKENMCLVDISTILVRHMGVQPYEYNKIKVQTICDIIRDALYEMEATPPVITYKLLPSGSGFKKLFIKPDRVSFSEYFWDRKHIRLWNNLLSMYSCALFRKKINTLLTPTKMLANLMGGYDDPFLKANDFTCYIKHSKNQLHARIFGVYTVGVFKELVRRAARYYEAHPKSFGSIGAQRADLYRIMQVPCVTALMDLDSVEKCLHFGRLYSTRKLW